MKYCHYHPLIAATYYCENCHYHHCDDCIDEGDQGDSTHCFKCQQQCESLGATYTAEPFWRRFQESFRYPLATETVIFIIGVALLNSIVFYLPFTLIWILMLSGIFMKYCFTCLENTAKGIFNPPHITTAYEGGILLAIKLIAIVLIMVFSVVGVQLWLGTAAASLYGMFILCCLPAVIINFSLSERVTDAINPLKNIALISAIGLPYGLLLAIIMVMLGSVSFINEMLGHSGSFLSTILQSSISNYYTVVLFHLMGYMLFQYQGQLGFIARSDNEKKVGRPASERLLANIDIHVKQGNYDKVLQLFQKGIKQQADNKKLHDRCFDFLLAIKNQSLLHDFIGLYLKLLIRTQARDQITLVYKRILTVFPHFIPQEADDRFLIAQECYQSGDSLSALKLINGFQKHFPDHPKLIQALELQVSTLRNLPNLQAQADKLATLVMRLKKRSAEKQKKPVKKHRTESPPSLSLEERIEANAEQYKPSTTKRDQEQSNNSPRDIDYDGGIDFK